MALTSQLLDPAFEQIKLVKSYSKARTPAAREAERKKV
jgi:hypothetical protein